MCTTDQTTVLQIADEVIELKRLLTESRQEAIAYRQSYDTVHVHLQDGLFEVDDAEERELIRDFLNEHSPWGDFTIRKTYRARITVEVTFTAENDDQAENIASDVSVESNDRDVEDWDVQDVTVDAVYED